MSPFAGVILMVAVFSTSIACQGASSPKGDAGIPSSAANAASSALRKRELSIEDVLKWRDAYGDLLDRPRDAAVERFGTEAKIRATNAADWSASSRTGERDIGILCADASSSAKIIAVTIYPRSTEALDVLEVIRHARLFNFGSGNFTDSVDEYFFAETKDRRNTLQFMIRGRDVAFHRAVFASEAALKR